MDRTVTTPDGRTLAVQEGGDPDGLPVLVHMGTPNSRHLYGPNVADATARGLLRPGHVYPLRARGCWPSAPGTSRRRSRPAPRLACPLSACAARS
jgi:pimeloyl-ACP methyl ester carboxylesterase